MKNGLKESSISTISTPKVGMAIDMVKFDTRRHSIQWLIRLNDP